MDFLTSSVTSHDLFKEPAIFVSGPTAIGKTELALTLAEEFGCSIIGVDSMQIYRYMDIGTAKPTQAERGRVPHYLIDYVLPDEEFSVSRYVRDCQAAIQHIRAKGSLPMLVGGTGLYFNALEKGIFDLPAVDCGIRQTLHEELESRGREVLIRELNDRDPVSGARIHPNDTYRLIRALEIVRSTGKTWSSLIDAHQGQQRGKPRPKIVKIGLERERAELYQRINKRVEGMANAGLLTEVENLLHLGYARDLQSMQSLGYRHMLTYLGGEWSWEKTLELLARDTRRYAKRQVTWFKADAEIQWFHPGQVEEICAVVSQFLKR